MVELQDRDWRSEVPHTVRENQICDHLRNLNIPKTTEPDEMHLRAQRELADEAAKSLSTVSESPGR